MSSNDYVEVSDIKGSLSNLPGTEQVVLVVTTSSLDDVIDRFNKLYVLLISFFIKTAQKNGLYGIQATNAPSLFALT